MSGTAPAPETDDDRVFSRFERADEFFAALDDFLGVYTQDRLPQQPQGFGRRLDRR